jgi:hypothetical protein
LADEGSVTAAMTGPGKMDACDIAGEAGKGGLSRPRPHGNGGRWRKPWISHQLGYFWQACER